MAGKGCPGNLQARATPWRRRQAVGASSGKSERHGLSYCGDREAGYALHLIAGGRGLLAWRMLALVLLSALVVSACGELRTGKTVVDEAPSLPVHSSTAAVQNPAAEPTFFQSSDDSVWQTHASMPGGPRHECAVVELNGEVVVLGGFNSDNDALAIVEAYDPVTNAWRSLASLPTPMHHANVAVLDRRMYVVGFLGPGHLADGRTFVYDPVDDSWIQLASMPPGQERGASAVAVVEGEIFVIGGLGILKLAMTAVSAFNPDRGFWRQLAPLPAPRDHATAAAIDGIIYVAGGRNGGLFDHTARLDAFDAHENIWSSRAPMPTSRAGAAGAVFDGRLYVLGGEGNSNSPNGLFDNVESYDPRRDEWASHPPMKTPRHGLGAVAVGERIYLPGGGDSIGRAPVSVNESFAP